MLDLKGLQIGYVIIHLSKKNILKASHFRNLPFFFINFPSFFRLSSPPTIVNYEFLYNEEFVKFNNLFTGKMMAGGVECSRTKCEYFHT